MAQQRLVLLFVVAEAGVGLNLDIADTQLFQRVPNQVAVDDLVVALVVVAEQVVVGSRPLVVWIVIAAKRNGRLDDLVERPPAHW